MMNVQLIACTKLANSAMTADPLAVVEQAASVCYDSKPTDTFRIAKGCMLSGHTSVFEHISFTFHVFGVSRALLAQLTRHRIASYSVRSQRYCDETDFDWVVPKSVRDSYEEDFYIQAMVNTGLYYEDLVGSGIPAEDARMVLPNACCTELVVTMNARALIQASRQRLCSRAQWEIRDLFTAMKREVAAVCPFVAEQMRPQCEADPEHPFCTETKSCGRHKKLAEVYQG